MAHARIGRIAYLQRRNLALLETRAPGYDRSMSLILRFDHWAHALRQHFWQVLLLGLALCAAGLLLLRPGGALLPFNSADVGHERPMHVVYAAFGAGESTPALAASPATGAAQANLALLSGDFFDFGLVHPNAVVQHDFLVVNRGGAPLVIQRAYTTCSCTTADISASVIPPGKASRVTLRFAAGVHAAAGQTVRRGLVLQTNDPDHPQAEIWVQASIGK